MHIYKLCGELRRFTWAVRCFRRDLCCVQKRSVLKQHTSHSTCLQKDEKRPLQVSICSQKLFFSSIRFSACPTDFDSYIMCILGAFICMFPAECYHVFYHQGFIKVECCHAVNYSKVWKKRQDFKRKTRCLRALRGWQHLEMSQWSLPAIFWKPQRKATSMCKLGENAAPQWTPVERTPWKEQRISLPCCFF